MNQQAEISVNDTTTGAGCRPKEVTGRMVLICLVAFFAVVAGVNGIMIRAAVSTFGGVETANSYQAGLAFAREIAAVESQDELHWDVRGKLTTDAGQTRLELIATDASGQALSGLDATARLVHPADRRLDHDIPLRAAGPGKFRGRVDVAAGHWALAIELSRDGTRLFRSRNQVFLR
jgi:nitrogen fixation protein FixH